MEDSRKYHDYSYAELTELIGRHRADKTFNSLGFYRSLLENSSLTTEQAITLRDLANQRLEKTFSFLQLKDPGTYLKLTLLGQEYTKADELEVWRQIVQGQQAILRGKRIRHRNFGVYSKHNCGYDWCPYNGLMVRQGSELAEGSIHFDRDKSRRDRKVKSDRMRTERKQFDPRQDLDS